MFCSDTEFKNQSLSVTEVNRHDSILAFFVVLLFGDVNLPLKNDWKSSRNGGGQRLGCGWGQQNQPQPCSSVRIFSYNADH